MTDTDALAGLREAFLAGVRRGASDGMEAYPEVADDYLAGVTLTPSPEASGLREAAQEVAAWADDTIENEGLRRDVQALRAALSPAPKEAGRE